MKKGRPLRPILRFIKRERRGEHGGKEKGRRGDREIGSF